MALQELHAHSAVILNALLEKAGARYKALAMRLTELEWGGGRGSRAAAPTSSDATGRKRSRLMASSSRLRAARSTEARAKQRKRLYQQSIQSSIAGDGSVAPSGEFGLDFPSMSGVAFSTSS